MDLQIDLNSAALAFASGEDSASLPVEGFAANSRMFTSLPSHVYHGDRESLSCSTLKPLLISPAHFQDQFFNLSSSTKAKDFGSLVHGLVLEPHLVGNEFAVFPGLADGRSPEYKSFVASNVTRLVVDEPTFTSGRLLAEKILNRKVMGRPFGDFVNEGQSEVSIYFQEPVTGVMLKVRPDLYHPEFTFDLKTTRHATISEFLRDGLSMGYDFQAFMYSLGRSLFEGTEKSKPFIFIAGESTAPHSINVVTAGTSFLNNGAKKFQEALAVYKACTDAGYFPDSGGDGVAEIEHWNGFTPNSAWKDALSEPITLH